MTREEAISRIQNDLKYHSKEYKIALNMAIKALERPEPCEDAVSRQAAIDVCNYAIDLWHGQLGEGIVIAVKKRIAELPSAQPEPKWIQVKTRPMTEDEREYWSEHYGYDIEYEYSVMFDCKMPKDKQAIWVQSKCGYVFEDICENDDGMIGLEGNGDWDDIVAWMPKYIPEPYREEGD